jgi:hypothetical protein
VASDRSRKFRSITGRISDIDKQVGSISRTIQNVTDGLGSDSVSADSILSESIGSDAIQIESITADKIAPSVFETASSGVQRVPAPVNSVNYWDLAISGNITGFQDAYFADKENKNVSVSTDGIKFSPEKDTQVILSTAELKEDGLVVLETRTTHGYEIGDYITVTNLGSPLDGEWVITDVPSTTSLCYTLAQFEEPNTNLTDIAYVSIGGDLNDDGSGYQNRIIQKSLINGVVTLVLIDEQDASPTSDAHSYDVGYVVNVNGLGSPYDGDHKITAIPDDQTNAIQYSITNRTIPSYTPRVVLKSGWGNGDFITFDVASSDATNPENSIHNISVNQFVEISGFTTNTGYNQTGQVTGVFGAGTTFTIASTLVPALDEPETGGTYYCYNAEIKAEANSVLFFTAKNPVPTSRNVAISWLSDNPIKFYIVFWDTSFPDTPFFLEVDANNTESIIALSGVNKYLWEVPDEIGYYAVYAEVLAGGDEVTVKECYVFESVGDIGKKVEKISNAFIASLANNANEITFYTTNTHSYEANDSVSLSGLDTISSTLNKNFTVNTVSADRKSFTISAPVVNIEVSTTSGSNLVYTTSVLDPISNITKNVDISGLIYVGQPYTSSNTTAMPNGTVTQILSSQLLSNTKTGLIATLASGANTVTLSSGNTEGITVGQLLTKTSGTGAFGNTGTVYVTGVTNATALTVDATHNTSGSTTFTSSLLNKNYDSFTVANNSGATNSAITLSFYLQETDANANVSLNASSIGGYNKHQTTVLNPSGLKIEEKTGQAINLTDDATDNYLSIYNTDSIAVATIDGTGQGIFANVETAGSVTANTVTVDGTVTSGDVVSNSATIQNLTANVFSATTFSANTDILISNTNTYVIGNFSNATYNNGIAYTNSYLNRLARGIIYNSYWDIPTTNIPSGVQYYGLANGVFKLEDSRAYQMFVGTGGLRITPNKNVAVEILLSTTPIRLTDSSDLARASYVLSTEAFSGESSQYFRDLSVIFQTVPATGSTFTNANTTNLTSATISSWSRANNSNTITVTLSNATPLTSYLKTGDYVSTNNMANANYHGTWQITKINTTAFSYAAYDVASAFTNTGTTGDITLVDPQMINLAATFSSSGAATSTPTTISYLVKNYFTPGQRVSVTGSLSPSTFLVSDAYVLSANANAFTVSSNAVGSNSTSTSSVFTVNWSANQLQANKTVLPSLTTIYWILRLRHASNTNAVSNIITTGNPAGIFSITDLGQTKSLTYSAPTQDWTSGFPPALKTGGATVPVTNTTTTTTTTFTTTLTVTSADSAYYDNYGKGDSGTTDPYTNEQSLYQGNPGTASGTKKSAVLFSTITYPGAHANNRVITKVELYLRNRHSYNASGLTTRIGLSTATSLGSSIPTTGVTAGPTPTTTTFTKGQGKWTTLGSGFHSYANASTLRTILISLTDQSPITYDSTLSNYGYFDGDLQSDPPKLRITYTYDVTT